ncbi:WD40 repeat domain-containing protein [Streptomyces sp. NPDC021080]|uniref:WD40 repeat domain-containing protein n=1 Tax=Streptomyces sp. NPDC021080 TaxID=3365110 RepID=UPI0037962865
MNVEELVREALREQAAEQPPPGSGLADRVLTVRRRSRNRRIVSAAVAVAAVLTAVVGVPRLESGGHDVRPSGVVKHDDRIDAQPAQSPPRRTVGAGNTVMAAYFTEKTHWQTSRQGVGVRTYSLLNPKSGRYEKTTRWSWVAVAPGLRTAAVLEQHLPVRRIGLLDLTSGKVERWIPVDHPVGGLEFSPDGTKLLATTYDKNPDHRTKEEGNQPIKPYDSVRTGFHIFDVASGKGSWAPVTVEPDIMGNSLNVRQDFHFCRDGKTVWGGQPSKPYMRFYDASGHKVSVSDGEQYRDWFVDAGLSPDGSKLAGDFAGEKWHTSSWLLDPRTGKHMAEIHGQQLLAWVNEKSLIAWDLGKADKNEFHPRLVLVTIGSDKEVPLSGFLHGSDVSEGRWEPVFARR